MSKKNPKASGTKPAPASVPPSRLKTWFGRIALMLGAPLIFFGLLELTLCLCGFGYPTSFLLPKVHGARKVLVQNNQFGWRFFGARMSRSPHPIALASDKPSGTIRIFVFGESAAFGDPQPRFGLPRMLEAMLDLRHPDKKFEVVNASMTGINSHVVLRIARDCAKAEGDVWVLYMGNNEVVGPFGAGTVFGAQAPPEAVVRASLALKTTRTGQLLDDLLQKLQPPPPEKSEWGGMVMFLNQRIAASDHRMERVYHHFRNNLEEIICAGRKCGVGIVACTVAVNLKDCAPFSSLHAASFSDEQLKQWKTHYEAGLEAQKAANRPEAEKQFLAAAKLDDSFADLHFQLANCELSLGRLAQASAEFAAARDLDALRFRCDGRLNDIIRQVSTNRESEQILLAETEGAVAAASTNGLPGAEFFYEHVHLTFEGNYILALNIADKVEKLLQNKLTPSNRPWPDISQCAGRLAWNARSRQLAFSAILGRLNDPPFTLQSDHAAQTTRLADESRTLGPPDSPQSVAQALKACETALASWPADPLVLQQLAELRQLTGQYVEAGVAAARSLEVLPENQECRLLLGLALSQQQKFEEAAAAFRQILESDPQDVWARQNLALCFEKLDRRDDAIREFKTALALKPRFGLAWLGLGQLYEKLGRNSEAAECFRKALANPIHRAEELTTVARFCQSRGWFEAALTNYSEAITLSPADPALRLETGQAFAALGRHAEAAQCYADSLQLSPGQGQVHFLLGAELGKLGRPDSAEQEFRKAAELMPQVVEARLNLGIALYQQGKRDEARAEFETVLQRSPTNSLALRYVQALNH